MLIVTSPALLHAVLRPFGSQRAAGPCTPAAAVVHHTPAGVTPVLRYTGYAEQYVDLIYSLAIGEQDLKTATAAAATRMGEAA